MTREIKFRAWDKTAKILSAVIEITFKDSIEGGGNGVVTEDYQGSLDRFALMQYTGLKANGKEIYEGDIIEIRHPHKERYYKGSIEYSELGARFIAIDFYFAHYDDPSDFTEGMKYVEVIGNIYENEDLLQ